MLEAAITIAIAAVASILIILSRKGYIELPKNKTAVEMIALGCIVGVGALFAGTYQAGWRGAFVCLGPVALIAGCGFLVGYQFYKRRQRNGSEIEKLDLTE
ncbi:MAG: hypothetical protein HOP17_01070 [Acidobacteria bacterium]|nr:hypothetical protein [Acidobacteriota bacterium]